MSNKALVSVIMPVYNTERYVTEAVESVLGQTYRPLELVCVNDGSTDASLEKLRLFGDAIRLVHLSTNSGIAAARNAGIRAAQGDFIAFMDSDDLWDAQKLSRQMAQFAQDPSLDISFTNLRCFLSPELSTEDKQARYCPPGPQVGYVAATAVAKKKLFATVGDFDPRWRVGEFIDWYTRASEQGAKSQLVLEVLLHRRIHNNNTGVVGRASRVDYVRIAREALARKRKKD